LDVEREHSLFFLRSDDSTLCREGPERETPLLAHVLLDETEKIHRFAFVGLRIDEMGHPLRTFAGVEIDPLARR
jgi:hypothetical protein